MRLSLLDLVCPQRSTCWLGGNPRYWTRRRRIKHNRRMREVAKLEKEIAVAVVDAFRQKFPAFVGIMSSMVSPLPFERFDD